MITYDYIVVGAGSGTKYDWEFCTEPEPHLGGRSLYHPRRKMLGGSSGQNAMIYIRGNRSMVGAVSTGHVRLRSADPLAKVAITFHYFAAPEDMDAMATGVERAREVSAADRLRDVVGKELHPGVHVLSRTQLEDEIRGSVEPPTTRTRTRRPSSSGSGPWT